MIDTTHLSDVHVLACTLYGEARKEPTEGILAIACVIRNRVTGGWGDYRGVCLQPEQFAVWADGPITAPDGKTTNHGRLAQLVADLKAGPVTDPRYQECAWIATGVIKNWVRDVTHGADHYHQAGVMPRPDWAKNIAPHRQVGKFVVYVLAPVTA